MAMEGAQEVLGGSVVVSAQELGLKVIDDGLMVV